MNEDKLNWGDMAKLAACYAQASAEPLRYPWNPQEPERDRCKAMALLIAEDAKAIRAEVSLRKAQRTTAEGGQANGL